MSLLHNIDSKDDYHYANPIHLKNQIGLKTRLYSGYSQQDSQEFLRVLLGHISTELNRIRIAPSYNEFKSSSKSKKTQNSDYNEFFLSREDSCVIDVFYSQLVNNFECCVCKFRFSSFEKILDYTLLLNDYDTQLKVALEKYFQDDRVKFEDKCLGCGQRSNHIKGKKISIIPKILIITLIRYNARFNRKVTSKVKFPESIDLGEFLDKEILGMGLLYRLES